MSMPQPTDPQDFRRYVQQWIRALVKLVRQLLKRQPKKRVKIVIGTPRKRNLGGK